MFTFRFFILIQFGCCCCCFCWNTLEVWKEFCWFLVLMLLLQSCFRLIFYLSYMYVVPRAHLNSLRYVFFCSSLAYFIWTIYFYYFHFLIEKNKRNPCLCVARVFDCFINSPNSFWNCRSEDGASHCFIITFGFGREYENIRFERLRGNIETLRRYGSYGWSASFYGRCG